MTYMRDESGVDPGAIPRLVEALRRLYTEGVDFSIAPSAARPKSESASLYGRLRERLARAEARVRSDAEARRSPTLFQETLYLRCQRGHRTGGRFRCENALGREAELRIAARPFSAGREPLSVEPALVVTPTALKLASDASTVITVHVDLAPCSEISRGVIEASLDLILDEALTMKLWIEIDVYELD
jgi:hypothetical protein